MERVRMQCPLPEQFPLSQMFRIVVSWQNRDVEELSERAFVTGTMLIHREWLPGCNSTGVLDADTLVNRSFRQADVETIAPVIDATPTNDCVVDRCVFTTDGRLQLENSWTAWR